MGAGVSRPVRLLVAGLAGLGVAFAGIAVVVVGPSPTRADTAPPVPGTPPTVSADPLPTVQVNGVVWSQVTVGNTVYATGSFTTARPAGSAPGTNETARANLLAYDLTTGTLIGGFNHPLNGQGRVITASPDGSRVYVGGDFTTVDGEFHNHVAALSTAGGGALVSTFNAGTGASVLGLAATNSILYTGGMFTSALGSNRARLAAFTAATGALLTWAPTADDNLVSALVLTPDLTRVIVGGRFSTLNHAAAYGLGALSATTGATLPWAANQTVRDAGANAGITSLRTDGQKIYGTGFVFGGGGNLEGSFAADPTTGDITWVEDCHGDSYDTFATGGVMYIVSHEHFCGNIGAWPQTSPDWTYHRATAFTTAATGTIAHNTLGGYADFYGNPDPTQLDWYPTLATGSYTGQVQAAWSATGNSGYLALGGEFPSVNGVGQQGLVRFAVRAIAPNRVGPLFSSTLTPNVASLSSGTARVAWTATYDLDNQALTYKVVRDGNTANPVYTTTVDSTFWQLPTIGFTDTGLTPGSKHSYRVAVSDPFDNSSVGSTVSTTVSAVALGAYPLDVKADGASNYWRLGEASGARGYNWAGFDDLTEQATVGHGAVGAIIGDPNTASTFDGTSTGTAATTAAYPAPDTFTEEAWVKTTSASGGKILGFGNVSNGISASYDRQLYMDDAGHILFGVYGGSARTLSGTDVYNNGQWHQVVASLSGAGMVLYIDGRQVGRNAAVTSGQPITGYWRVGGDNLANWPSRPTSMFLDATIDEVAIYPTVLSAAAVQKHYVDSGRAPTVPSDGYGQTIYNAAPDLYWRLDDPAGPVAKDASPNGVIGTYSGGVTYNVSSPVTGPGGTAVRLDGSTGLIVSQTAVTNPTVYSEELWFNTTTTAGGKLIGFGNAASGTSTAYDRHVWMLNTGQLSFAVWTGQATTIMSPASYNDGRWHFLTATQGSDGMHLYVDGQQVATNPQTHAQNYRGYWRVGGDLTGGGNSSSYFAGAVDEVAVYPTELPAATVLTHYNASPAHLVPPRAAFVPTCTALACTFDGSGSSDPDGTVTGYAWRFGDGSTGTGAVGSHTYAAAGDYLVTLTVTDNQGAIGTVSQTLSPRPAANPVTAPFAVDTFNRTVASGLGTANTGGTWAVSGGAGPRSVAAGSAAFTMAAAGATTGAYLPGVPASDAETDVTLTTDKPATGDGTVLYVVGRHVTTNDEYRARIRLTAAGTVAVALTELNGSATETVLKADVTVAGVVYTPGMALKVRFQVVGTGPTALRLKVWPSTATEPAAWQLTTSATAAGLQHAGSVGLGALLPANATNAPVVMKASAFRGVPTAAAPTASFTAACTGLVCSANGSASTDPGTAITSYQWSWGDGTVATGATASRTFVAPGTYRITLTVTNGFGWTNVTTRTVIVPA